MAPTVTAGYAPRRRRGPLWLVPVALLGTLVIELAVIITVGRQIGAGLTILLLILSSLIGAWFVRREGRRTWRTLATTLRSGQMPSREIADAVLVFLGGALLTVPGFVTDLVGFILVLPFTRPIARIGLEVIVARRLLAIGVPGPTGASPRPQAGPAQVRRTEDRTGEVIEGEIVEGEIVDDE